MAELTTTKLIEKIVRAKVKIEALKRDHLSSCITEMDDTSHAPCDCGVSQLNAKIDSVLEELKLEG